MQSKLRTCCESIPVFKPAASGIFRLVCLFYEFKVKKKNECLEPPQNIYIFKSTTNILHLIRIQAWNYCQTFEFLI